MRRFIYILLTVGLVGSAHLTLISCRGKAATKTIEVIEKAASKSGKAAKNVGRYGDDVIRAADKMKSSNSSTTAITVQCSACAGYGQVNFVDEYGNYDHTGTCPECNGEGTITKYE